MNRVAIKVSTAGGLGPRTSRIGKHRARTEYSEYFKRKKNFKWSHAVRSQ